MPTDILLKQVLSSIEELKAAVAGFEKHASPSTQYAEQLHDALTKSNKLVSAYLVLKQQKDVSPDLDLHLKVMAVTDAVKTVEQTPLTEPVVPAEIKAPELLKEVSVTPVAPDEKPVANIPAPVKDGVKETPVVPVEIKQPSAEKELPKINISINDKFRFINELFKGNGNEYSIAIEQINSLQNNDEAQVYLKGLKSIYEWDEENEIVKKIFSLTQKRFS